MKTILALLLTSLLSLVHAEEAIAIKVSPHKICKEIESETEQMYCNEIKNTDKADEDFVFVPSQLASGNNLVNKMVHAPSDIGDDFVFEENTAYPEISKALNPSLEHTFYDDQNAPEEIILLRKHFGRITDGKTPNSLTRQTGHLFIIGVGFMGILLNLPPSIVKWDEEEKIDPSRLFQKYFDNIKNGPVVDNDDWVINYIGHPVSGAWYYTMARQMGLNPAKSFLYSTVMSTLFWEFGVEAFAEKPSLQDLIITPVIGSILGEVFWQINRKIIENGYDRTIMGKVAQFLMNPAGMTGQGIHHLFQRIGANVDITTSFKIVPRTNYVEDDGTNSNWVDQFALVFSLELVF